VLEIVESGLDEAERAALRAAADEVRGRVADLEAMGLMPAAGTAAAAAQAAPDLREAVRDTLL
jgi:hypothetical protein